jgi:multiple sugar transport system permease protein
VDDVLVHRAGGDRQHGLGLAVAIFFNREFRLRKTARSLVILSYVTPSISLVFAWKYMFNNGYGIVNYLGVDLLHLYDQAPLWFDNPAAALCWWCCSPSGATSRTRSSLSGDFADH